MIGNLSFKTKYSQLGGSFFLLGVFIVASLSLASAKPLPPDHLSLEVVAAGNLFEWQNAGNDGQDPPDTFDHYVVYIDTQPADYQKGNFAQITTTELSFLHPVASLTAGQDYYYCVEAWDTNDNTQKSGTLKRFWPRDGYAVDGQILKHKDTVWASWKPYDGDHLKTFVGLSTAMGDNPNVVSWIDVGHQTSYVFTGLNLTAGQTYYVSVKIQDLDAYKGNYGAVICSSNGFTVNLTEVFTDTASTSFFNNALHIVGTRINADDVTTANFSNNGGGIWSYRAPITVTERGIEDRLNAPCEFCLVRPSGEFPTNSADQEIRISDELGVEATRSVPLEAVGGGNRSATMTFIVNVPKGSSRTYWVYWGNAGATAPNYGPPASRNGDGMGPNTDYDATDVEAMSRRKPNYTPYYSRKSLLPGIEAFSLGAATKLGSPLNPNDDDGNAMVGLPWTFQLFDSKSANIYFSSNGILTVGNYPGAAADTADKNIFYQDGHLGMISPFFANTMANQAYPSDSGLYWIRMDAGLPTDRVVFYSRNNHFDWPSEMFLHQAVLYRYGDIALRYEYLSGSPIYLNESASKKKVDGSAVGVSKDNNSDWLSVKGGKIKPLIEGLNMTPTFFFQSKTAMQYSMGAVEGVVAGWVYAGHIDSQSFDSRSSTPDWATITYNLTNGGGRLSFYTRTGGTPNPDGGGWSAWAAAALAQTVNGSAAIPSPKQRYIQYRCVFEKSAFADDPLLQDVSFSVRGLRVLAITNDSPLGISQGQDNVTFRATLENYHSAPATLTSAVLSPSLGNCSISLVSPTVPYSVPALSTITATFSVSVDSNSPTGTSTFDCAASATAPGLTFEDNGADTPLQVWIRKKADLSISAIDATPFKVSKGQKNIPVRMFIDNLGETPFSFGGATLTFSFGTHLATMSTPALGTIVSGPGSMTATFTVEVASSSQSGEATIGGTASGTNTFSNKITDDATATTEFLWIIQSRPEFVIDTIVASSIVTVGQTGIPVQVTTINIGEAEAFWDLSSFTFSLGAYDNVHPLSVMPTNLYGDYVATTVWYAVDVSPLSATGVATIDANLVRGRDANDLGTTIEDNWALSPATWTIVEEYVTTYKDPGLLIPATSFNRPPTGNTQVYAKGQGLAPYTEYAVRWFNASGAQVDFTDPPLSTNASGVLSNQYGLTAASPIGIWTVRVTNPLGTVVNCETNFTVTTPASASVAIYLPSTVSVGQTFVATMTMSTIGAGVNSAQPSQIATSGTGVATKTGGPTPLVQVIPPDGQATFTWTWNALTPGTFIASVSGSGFDANSDDPLTTATESSNVLTIQTAPVLSVVNIAATPTTVYRNETGIEVAMQVRNTGQAGASIEAASLSFTVGTYTQSVASPSSLPWTLAGGQNATLTFTVAVDALSPLGDCTITGSFRAHDVNNPSTIFGPKNGTDTWTVNSVIGYCSANANFNPEQYTFNVGQTIFVRFEGPATRKDYYIQYFNAPTGGTQVASSPALYSRKYATYDDFQLITAGWAPGNYRVRITKSGTWTDLGVQHFKVQVPGNLVATLTIAPTEVYVGDTFTVSLATTNNISTAASTITTATPSALTPVATSTGNATLVSGPTPSSVSLAAGGVATITWTYNATADSGAGDYALTALLASSITGIDINTGLATGSNKCVSNNLKIYKESLDLSVTTWDLGSGGPGDTLATVSATLTNGGNSDFTAIRWSKYDFAGPGGNSIPKSYSILDPDPVGSLASGSNMPVYSSLIVPYGQATGTYIATMSVFEDKNGSTFRDFGEAFDMFNPKVLVLPKTKIVALTKTVDFGDWPPDNNTATMPVSILSAGNISLASVKIRKTNGDVTLYKDSSVISQNPGPMAVMQTYVASFGIYIPPAFASGLYIATYTAWDDVDGDGTVNGTEASDTFQGRVNIGNKKFTCDFSPVNAGNATPPRTISGLNQRITNTGEFNLTALKANFQPLIDGFGHSIATDNIDMAFPASIASGASATCLVSLYVPAGQYVGTYSAVQQVYEDGNGNGVWDTSEASSTFTLSVHVNPSAGIQVLVSTVDLGDMSAGGTATATFDCRNSGNTDLSGLRWEKVVLQNGGFSIATGQYWFPPSEPFFATAGAFFTRDLQITVPVVQDAGLYTGSSAWLFDSPDAVRDLGEPQDSFIVMCRVGTPALDILEPTLTTSGNPATFSATFPFNVKNVGQANLLVPRATGTALIGPGTIFGSQNVFTPNPLPYIAIGATGAGAWKVSIPPLATAGLYIATMTVWNDANSDQIQQSSEASDTARLELTVNANRVLSVVQNPLDLGLATAGSIVNGTIEIRNDGNIDLTNIRGLGAVLTSSFDSIPAANATFTDPIGALAIGASILATVTVTIGDPRFSGTYNGIFQVYDDYNTANGAFDSGSEEFASFPVTLQVGQKALSVTNPVAFGTQNPGATYNQAFNVSNTGDFDLSQGNWKVGSMTYGALTIPAASLTFTTPAAPFSLAVSETKPGNAQVVVDIYQPPGDYVGTSTAWADEDWDGTIDPNEASGTFQTTLTVATYPGLNVIPFTVACGNIAAGGSSAEKGFQYQNTGNATLTFTGSSWFKADLTGAGTIPIGSFSFSPGTPADLSPGMFALASVTIGPISQSQTLGTYFGTQKLISFEGASDSFDVTCDVLPGGPVNLSTGTVYQEIGTPTFQPPGGRFVLSAFACPGTGSARIEFFDTDNNGNKTNSKWVDIDSNGNLTASTTSGGESGIVESFPVKDFVTGQTFTWYRLYVSFDYSLDPALASKTYIMLGNSAPPTASYSVWFDGVQFEQSSFAKQTRPTVYEPKKKIVSPNTSLDMTGRKSYSEW